MFVAEIPAGGALNPEQHMYEEYVYVLQGRGATEVTDPASGRTSVFEWEKGALFAPPLNVSHRLFNTSGSEPAVVMGLTNAPLVFDLYHSPEFVLGNPFVFKDRYAGQPDYFALNDKRYTDRAYERPTWETNFLPDVRTATLDSRESKGSSLRLTQLEMSEGVLVTHIADWPSGRYQKGHYHGAGAVILIVKGSGYAYMWPKELGHQPFKNGKESQVLRLNWKEGSVYSPPEGWFHQHYATGHEQARQLAFRYGSVRYRVEFHEKSEKGGAIVSIRDGGALVNYEDEDPHIRQEFEAQCAAHNVPVTMPPVTYRTD
jgi:oxalate decarboxylase/phosphoglucose isomerase-like protein (cupin superfamily)